MRIGNINLPAGAGLAPMAGVTDAAMRLLCHESGAAWAVSEMLSAKGWIYSGGKNQATRELLTRLPGEGIAGLQLFGREPELMARAAQELESAGFEFIDLNFGCPAPKITGNGEGSALMREPERIGEIVSAVSKATRLPVTAKIRAGWDETCINAPEVARICESSGAQAIAVHARTRMQQYSGRADWSIIKKVKKSVSVPVLGNGDVRSGADAVNMIAQTGCDGVIVGRAAQGNPWIFAEIRSFLTGEAYAPPTPRERVDMALRHFDLETRLHGEKKGLLEMRKHIAWYVSGLPGAAKFRDSINLLTDAAAVKDALCAFAQKAE
ncbi:MAG: tRNA dihydrouridine synthase DusB [Candidatus Faecivicinus sp.]|nr:tRNA dihydrouridine synthase DusB [Candidatus Faecivicinus sp.]